jgi:hypothetical protein
MLLLIQSPYVQTKLTQKIAAQLSKKLNTQVEVKGVSIAFFSSVALEGLYVADQKQDTLLYADRLTVAIDKLYFPENHINISDIALTNTLFQLKKYASDSTNNLQFIIDAFTTEDTSATPWTVGLNNINLTNCRFVYENQHRERSQGVDFNHLNLREVNVSLTAIEFDADTIRASIEQIGLKDHSGFNLNKLQSKATISPSKIDLQNLLIRTPESNISTDLTFNTKSYADYNDFIANVKLLSNFNESNISSADIAYFAPSIKEMEPQYVSLQGLVKGTIANLKVRDLKLMHNLQSSFEGNVDLKGLPELDETFIYLSVKDLSTKVDYLESLPVQPFSEKKRLQLPEELRKLGAIHFKGKFTGFLSDFVAYGRFQTNLGSVSTDITIKGHGDEMKYSGLLKTKQFQLGQLFSEDSLLGSISMNAEVNGKGTSKASMKARINGVISALDFNHYTYRNIALKGNIANQLFNGDLVIKDPLLDMDFIGSIDLSKELPELNFLSNINHCSVGRLFPNEKTDTSFEISTTLNIDIQGNSIDNLNGKLALFNTRFTTEKTQHVMNELQLVAQSSGQRKSLDLKSDIADIQIVGNYELEQLPNSYGPFIRKYIPAIVGHRFDTVSTKEDFNFNVRLKNTELLSELFFPKSKVDSGAFITGYYNSQGNQLTLDANFTGARINNTRLTPGFITVQTQENSLYLNAEIDKVLLSDGIYMDGFSIVSETKENQTDFNFNWKNLENGNYGNIIVNASYLDLHTFEFAFSDSYFKIADTNWTIRENSLVRIDSSSLFFDEVMLRCINEEIEITGRISENPKDELNVYVKDFNIHNFNLLIPEKTLKLNGHISGQATVKDPYNNLIFTSDVAFKNFSVNNNPMGDGSLKSFWINEMEVLNVNSTFLRDSLPTIKLKGNYFPKREKDNIDLTLELQRTYLRLFQPYLEGTLSNLKGIASGRVHLSGSPEKPILKGKINLQKVGLTVDYLNTTYFFSDQIIIEPDWIGFNDITIFDAKGGKARASGTVFHSNFENFNLDLFLIAEKFHCLNTAKTDNSLYYGQGFISGEVNIGGYANNLNIDATVSTQKSPDGRESTSFNIPLDNPDEASENSFVKFINTKDTVSTPTALPSQNLSGIQMNFNLDVTSDAEVRIIFDEKIGDILKSRGNGNLRMEINTKGDFNMFGEYIIDQGDYLFTLQNVINKRFNLERGGVISWNGDPYAGTVDLSAIYKLRARLSDIIIVPDSTSSNYTKRTPIELVLNMENTILQPDISFDIRLPTADENTKSQLRNVLYVGSQSANENLMNKQAFSLLILNRFTPPEQGLSGSGFGATSSSELLSNQLSNWLSQISSDVDVGFTYRPGDELSSDQVEVALSTQLFNDRIVIDGNFEYGGNQNVNQSTQQNTNTLVGDVSVEYKIREDGKLRVRAFNKSNNNSFLDNNNPYTQGVGLSYRQDFETGKGLWKKIFGSGKKEEEEELESE